MMLHLRRTVPYMNSSGTSPVPTARATWSGRFCNGQFFFTWFPSEVPKGVIQSPLQPLSTFLRSSCRNITLVQILYVC